MLEQVESKIEELNKEQTEEYYKRKDADLTSWGLTSKKNGKKQIPLIVTDDEYEALIKASNGTGRAGRNPIANLLVVLSIVVLVIGIITGAVLMIFSEELGFVYLSISVIIGGIVAAILRGIAEAVKLLQQLIDQKQTMKPKSPLKNQTKPQPPIYQQPYAQAQPSVYVQPNSYAQPVQQQNQ